MLKLKYYKGEYEYDIDHPLHVFTKQTLPLTNEPKTYYACITHQQKTILKPSLMFQLDIVKNNVINLLYLFVIYMKLTMSDLLEIFLIIGLSVCSSDRILKIVEQDNLKKN